MSHTSQESRLRTPQKIENLSTLRDIMKLGIGAPFAIMLYMLSRGEVEPTALLGTLSILAGVTHLGLSHSIDQLKEKAKNRPVTRSARSRI